MAAGSLTELDYWRFERSNTSHAARRVACGLPCGAGTTSALHYLQSHYLTHSNSVLPVSAVGSRGVPAGPPVGITVRMVLPWPSERLAVPVVRVDRYRSLPSRR